MIGWLAMRSSLRGSPRAHGIMPVGVKPALPLLSMEIPYHEGDGVLFPVHSVTKSITSALTGIAIEEGILKGTDQKVLDSFPEEGSGITDPNKAAITIKHLLTNFGYGYGYQWWGGQDYYFASGSFGQGIFVSPKHNFVAVMTSDMDFSTHMSETNHIFTRILRTVKSDDAAPADADGTLMLQEQLRLAGSPPKAVPDLPAVASAISGKPYELYRLYSPGAEKVMLSLTFPENTDTAILKLGTQADSAEMVIGLDNVYRKSSEFIYKFRFNDTSVRMELIGQSGKSRNTSVVYETVLP